MELAEMQSELKRARKAWDGMNPMIKIQAAGMFEPLMNVLEGMVSACDPDPECLGECKGCGIDCPARGQ